MGAAPWSRRNLIALFAIILMVVAGAVSLLGLPDF